MVNKYVETQNMGETSSKVFAGNHKTETTRQMYSETADFFADQIRERLLDKTRSYSLADIGSYQGELLSDILVKLPGYKFNTIAIDINEEALTNNKADRRIIANAEELPLDDNSIDLVIVRYLLQWNNQERQKKILQEIARVIKNFAIIEHVGSDVVNSDEWRINTDKLLSGNDVLKMKRAEHFFSSRVEIENWMNDVGIKFERIRERIIQNAENVYIERFNLNEDEARKTKQILGDKNFFYQTDWIIHKI